MYIKMKVNIDRMLTGIVRAHPRKAITSNGAKALAYKFSQGANMNRTAASRIQGRCNLQIR
jgi:hypothetical protein